MKIKPEHFNMLKEAIEKIDSEYWRERYRNNDFPRADRCKDKNMRCRWDLLYASKVDTSEMYKYLNGDHLDTALRRIVKPLEV